MEAEPITAQDTPKEPPPLDRLRTSVLEAVKQADMGLLKRLKDVLDGPSAQAESDRISKSDEASSEYRKSLNALRRTFPIQAAGKEKPR